LIKVNHALVTSRSSMTIRRPTRAQLRCLLRRWGERTSCMRGREFGNERREFHAGAKTAAVQSAKNGAHSTQKRAGSAYACETEGVKKAEKKAPSRPSTQPRSRLA